MQRVQRWSGALAVLMAGASLAACGASPTATGPSPKTMVAQAMADAVHGGWVHEVATTRSGRDALSMVNDIGTTEGRQVIDADGARSTVMVLGGTAYINGDASAVADYFGIPTSDPAALAGKWITVPHTDPDFSTVSASVTLQSDFHDVAFSGPYSALADTTVDGVAVVPITGRIPGPNSNSSTRATLYVTVTGTRLPVELTATTGKTVETAHWSAWVDRSPSRCRSARSRSLRSRHRDRTTPSPSEARGDVPEPVAQRPSNVGGRRSTNAVSASRVSRLPKLAACDRDSSSRACSIDTAMELFSIDLVMDRARVGPSANRPAQSATNASSSSSATTRLTRPNDSASAALRMSAKKASSLARCRPMSRGRSQDDPEVDRQAPLGEDLREPGRCRCHHQVTAEGQGHAGPGSHPAHLGDGRLGDGVESEGQLAQGPHLHQVGIAGATGHVGGVGQVGAGAEGTTGSGQDHGPDVAVSGHVVEQRPELSPHGPVGRVLALGTVHGHRHHATVAIDEQGLPGFGHRVSLRDGSRLRRRPRSRRPDRR